VVQERETGGIEEDAMVVKVGRHGGLEVCGRNGNCMAVWR